MHHYPSQILGGTHLDAQGECLTKQQLERFCAALAGGRIALHQRHEIEHEPVGYAENLRLEPDRKSTSEWHLIGDVSITRGSLDEALNGFSISFMEPLRDVKSPELLLYLPYPHYNDEELIGYLSVDDGLKIGRWIKKNADPATIAMFGTGVLFVLRPAWDQVYKEKIAPLVTRFLNTHGELLREKGVGLEHVQYIDLNGRRIEIRFVQSPYKGNSCFSPDLIQKGIQLMDGSLARGDIDGTSITRVVFCFDPIGREYYIERVE